LKEKGTFTAAHWGIYRVASVDDGGAILIPWESDPSPPVIGFHRVDDDINRLRVRRPAIRRGWLEHGPQGRRGVRGEDTFVEVDWNEALDLVAGELRRVRAKSGNRSIFGGSYGWASAGRFHHAQSQIHRFLNGIGGYVRQLDSYSLGAGRVLMPHVVAGMDDLITGHTSWDVMAAHTQLFVAFGGVPAKNAQVSSGGAAEHRTEAGLKRMASAGVRFVNISPVNDNLDIGRERQWIKIRPNTDTALMLALAYVIYSAGLHDTKFLGTYCVGFDRFLPYLLGESDGVPKTPDWAEAITGVPAAVTTGLARDIAASRTMLNAAWALQRAAHGEQPFWMLVTLASMVGQIGLPGGGFGVGYGTTNTIGSSCSLWPGPRFSQGHNPVSEFIPCARVADMLLHPGESFSYNGRDHQYPHVSLIYWAGGNPYHHHQDLSRLRRAWQEPETVIVHEQFWTASAKMADIVLPANLSIERNDIGYAKREGVLVAMRKVLPSYGDSKSDFDIFCELAARLGTAEVFSEGRAEMEWLAHIYEEFRDQSNSPLDDLPTFQEFWTEGIIDRRDSSPVIMLQEFRSDPEKAPLKTPTGKIEIFSEAIASFGYSDCGGHPAWFEPFEWLGGQMAATWPLHLLSDQPKYRLHSQFDHSPASRAGKIGGREPVYINSQDAAARGIEVGDIVEVLNDRGRCLAAAIISDDIMPGVARLATGAWFDPGVDSRGIVEKHGNPNAVTLDRGASSLSQGCVAQTCLVEIRRYLEVPPEVSAFDVPFPYRCEGSRHE